MQAQSQQQTPPLMQLQSWPASTLDGMPQPPVPPTSMPTPMFGGSMPVHPNLQGSGGGQEASPGLQFMLPQQDARFHFSGEHGFSGGGYAPSIDDMLAAFMPGCERDSNGYLSGGGSSGNLASFPISSGTMPHISRRGSPARAGPHQATPPYRPLPLSNGSNGQSGGSVGGPSPAHTGSGGSGASRLRYASSMPAAGVTGSAPASLLLNSSAPLPGAAFQHEPMEHQAQQAPAAQQQSWWTQQVSGGAAAIAPSPVPQPGLLSPVQIPDVTALQRSAAATVQQLQPQQSSLLLQQQQQQTPPQPQQQPQTPQQPQQQQNQQSFAMMHAGTGGLAAAPGVMGGMANAGGAVSGIPGQLTPQMAAQWQQMMAQQHFQWQQQMAAMFAAGQVQQQAAQQPAQTGGGAMPMAGAQTAAAAQPAAQYAQQQAMMQQMQAAWLQHQAPGGGFPGSGMPGFPCGPFPMPLAAHPWQQFCLGQRFGQQLATQQLSGQSGAAPVAAAALPKAAASQPPKGQASLLPAGSMQSAGSNFVAQPPAPGAAGPPAFPAAGWHPSGISGPLGMLSDSGLANVKWEYPAGEGGHSQPGSGRSEGGSGAASVPDTDKGSAGANRQGSDGPDGAQAVPKMPASARLACSIMPPPDPPGGLAMGQRMTRRERLERYREKKARRTDGATVRYHARQANAHRRPRIKGRFVKAGELADFLAANPDDAVPGGITEADMEVVNGVDADAVSAAPTSGDDTAVALTAPCQVPEPTASQAGLWAASVLDSPAAQTA